MASKLWPDPIQVVSGHVRLSQLYCSLVPRSHTRLWGCEGVKVWGGEGVKVKDVARPYPGSVWTCETIPVVLVPRPQLTWEGVWYVSQVQIFGPKKLIPHVYIYCYLPPLCCWPWNMEAKSCDMNTIMWLGSACKYVYTHNYIHEYHCGQLVTRSTQIVLLLNTKALETENNADLLTLRHAVALYPGWSWVRS